MLWCITFAGMGSVSHDLAQYVTAPDIRAALDTFDAHIAEVWGKGRTLVKSCALVTTGRVIGGEESQSAAWDAIKEMHGPRMFVEAQDTAWREALQKAQDAQP